MTKSHKNSIQMSCLMTDGPVDVQPSKNFVMTYILVLPILS